MMSKMVPAWLQSHGIHFLGNCHQRLRLAVCGVWVWVVPPPSCCLRASWLLLMPHQPGKEMEVYLLRTSPPMFTSKQTTTVFSDYRHFILLFTGRVPQSFQRFCQFAHKSQHGVNSVSRLHRFLLGRHHRSSLLTARGEEVKLTSIM